MLSDMMITERSSTLGYQYKTSLIKHLRFMPLEIASLCNLVSLVKIVIPSTKCWEYYEGWDLTPENACSGVYTSYGYNITNLQRGNWWSQ